MRYALLLLPLLGCSSLLKESTGPATATATYYVATVPLGIASGPAAATSVLLGTVASYGAEETLGVLDDPVTASPVERRPTLLEDLTRFMSVGVWLAILASLWFLVILARIRKSWLAKQNNDR